MAVGEGLFGVLQHEDEVVYKHHESPNVGTDCGSTECGTIRLNHLNAKSLNPRHACMAVGEGLFGVLQHEDEVVYKHHESPNVGTDCGSTECGTIRLNHYRYF